MWWEGEKWGNTHYRIIQQLMIDALYVRRCQVELMWAHIGQKINPQLLSHHRPYASQLTHVCYNYARSTSPSWEWLSNIRLSKEEYVSDYDGWICRDYLYFIRIFVTRQTLPLILQWGWIRVWEEKRPSEIWFLKNYSTILALFEIRLAISSLLTEAWWTTSRHTQSCDTEKHKFPLTA